MRLNYSYQIRSFVVDKLSAISVNGAAVPVYDLVPDNAQAPYVIVDNITEAPSNDMEIYGSAFEVTLQIITYYKGNVGGRKFNDQVLNEITKALTTRQGQQVDGMWIVSVMFTGKSEFIEVSTYKRVRTIVSFQILNHGKN